ncbi:hypothetical protein EVA_21801 [gut metagenome]|uniref:Uncharacterized protein n=1 Tax=gut metagenome TaxID=749906 RepID=J9FRV4_9ZZZZ
MSVRKKQGGGSFSCFFRIFYGTFGVFFTFIIQKFVIKTGYI